MEIIGSIVRNATIKQRNLEIRADGKPVSDIKLDTMKLTEMKVIRINFKSTQIQETT